MSLNFENKNLLKILTMSSIGAMFECYDFMICVFLSTTLIKIFYNNNQAVGIFYIFTVAYFARPIGGIFWGHIGDKYGRKKVFSLTMALLLVPTLMIAFFPVYSVSSSIASISFTILRFLQGFLVGGEFPGGITFIAEISKNEKRGLFLALFMSALNCGTLIASLICLMLNIFMTKQDILVWGWRLPFIFSIGLVVVAIYVRNKVQETSIFCNMKKRKDTSRVPLFNLLSNYKFLMLFGFILTCCAALGTTTIYTFLHQLIKFNNTFTEKKILYLTTIGLTTMCLIVPFLGYLSDKYGRKVIYTIGLFGTTISWGLFVFAIHKNNFTVLLIGMVSISILFGAIVANYCVILAELFPTNVRYSGVAVCYTLGYSICGGLIPIFYMHYFKFSQSLILPWICFALITLVTTFLMTKFDSLHKQKLIE